MYLDHTGAPTWRQRAWIAVLRHRPAALYGVSAIRAVDGGACGDQRIHVAIDSSRSTPPATPGVKVHFVGRLEARALWTASPPRQRYEDAVVDVAAGAPDDLAAVAVLTRACSERRTTPTRLRGTVDARTRIARRAWLVDVLDDLAAGACSVLEHGYLVRVERPHGLPPAARQQRGAGRRGVVYRDVEYDGGAVVELDGRAFHDSPEQRAADLDRDLSSMPRACGPGCRAHPVISHP